MEAGLSDRTADGLLGRLMSILNHSLLLGAIGMVLLMAGVYLRLRGRPIKSTTPEFLIEKENWTEDPKPIFEMAITSEFPHPLDEGSMFHQIGIPTSGDLARRDLLFANSSLSPNGLYPVSIPNSGDIAALAGPPPTLEVQQHHPWRRHSYPDRRCRDGKLTHHQTNALITEDGLEFFRADEPGKLWRRRTLEFGSPVTA